MISRYSLRSLQLTAAALRLAKPSSSLLAKSRSFTTRTTTPSALRILFKPQSTQPPFLFQQRRWTSESTSSSSEPVKQELDETERVETAESEPREARTTEEAAAAAEVGEENVEIASESSGEPPMPETEVSHESVSDASIADAAAAGGAIPAADRNAGFNTTGTRRVQDRPFQAPEELPEKETVYVGNLFFDVTEADLKKDFERFGLVRRAKIVVDVRGLSKGFGYVEYDSMASANEAVENMNMQIYEGRRIIVAYAHTNISAMPAPARGPNPRNPPSKTLFIGNLSYSLTDRDLNQLFREIRNVTDVRVAIDRRTGQPRGFAHADFLDVPSCQDAYALLNGKDILGRRLRCDYSTASRSARRVNEFEGNAINSQDEF